MFRVFSKRTLSFLSLIIHCGDTVSALALILISIVAGMLTGFFFDVDYIEGLADKVYDLGPAYIVSTFNWFYSIMLAIQVIICAGGTFYRLKTIKL